ncbi:hypothetical protein [Oryzifoliimicrobium ureilyticus]|uniref:hypothetical protein n=1 Tax=Oryzifoliimicrobium ureilyticus TaxID=3113724 RepID=UPI003076500D
MTHLSSMATRWATRLLCVLALVLLGLGHQPPAFAGTEATQISLPDGTVPSLCITGSEKIHDHQHSHDGSGLYKCEACRIAAGTLLPSPPEFGELYGRPPVSEKLSSEIRQSDGRFLVSHKGPRAPPMPLQGY